jgi:hypothetical protein
MPKNRGKKPRTHVAGVENETPQAIRGVTITSDGKVTFNYVDPNAKQKSAWIATYRERNKGPKTLVRATVNPGDLKIGFDTILRNYDHVFAIDTNNRRIGETMFSVSHVAQVRLRGEMEAEIDTAGCFVFTDAAEKQENIGWSLLLREIFKSADHKTTNKYAIITDSDLGNHEAYNKREKPFLSTEVLPENATFLYASEEGQATINQAINLCDKGASTTLAEIESGAIPADFIIAVPNAPYSRFLCIFNTNGKYNSSGWFRIMKP